MTIEEYFGDWLKVIDKEELAKVTRFVSSLDPNKTCPRISDIFRAFNKCKYNECTTIFLGQDPYPQKGVATGLSFGNSGDIKNISPSLQILEEAAVDYRIHHDSVIFDYTLESWANQGILLLNSALTCEVGKPDSHSLQWRSFISKLLQNICIQNIGIIFVLFGERAKSFKPFIDDFQHIIEAKHPAYYARNNEEMPTSIFKDINSILKGKYNTTINWFNTIDII